MRLFVYNGHVINVDNDLDAETLLNDPQTERELTAVEVDTIFGEFSYLAGAGNTTVNADGSIDFYPPELDDVKSRKKREIQYSKKEARDSGVTVNGVLWDTDEAARLAYQSFAVDLAANGSATTANWKPSKHEAYTTMDAGIYTAVWTAYKTLETSVYEWQASQDELVDAAKSVDEVANINSDYETES